MPLVGAKKTRVVARWLEAAGFNTALEERRFGPWTSRGPHDPAVAFCGVDNAPTRADLGSAEFELVVEAGLGAGPGGFRNFSLHSFPSSRRPDQIWRCEDAGSAFDVSSMPAYSALRELGLDTCGLAQLASRTVGVPFVGLIAAALAVSEPLRRLHGADGVEIASGSALNLNDIECVRLPFSAYAFGHLPAQKVSACPMSSPLYQGLCWLTHWGDSRIVAGLIQDGMEDLRHAISGQIARGLFG